MTNEAKKRKIIRDRERYYRERDKILADKRLKHHLNKEAKNAKQREGHGLNKASDNKRSAEWRSRNQDKASKYGKDWREKNPERAIIGRIASTYNLSIESAGYWYKQSMTPCDSCGTPWEPDNKRRLFIDHDHITGHVRGILCHHCNSALGLLKEDNEKILALLLYNRNFNGKV